MAANDQRTGYRAASEFSTERAIYDKTDARQRKTLSRVHVMT
jgi:hypothetical protein